MKPTILYILPTWKFNKNEPGMVRHTCNLSTWLRQEDQDESGLYSETVSQNNNKELFSFYR